MSSAPLTKPVVAIRDALDTDVDAIRAIYAHHVLHNLATFEEVPPSIDEMRRRMHAIVEQGLPYLVASIDGQVAGYCYASPYRPRSAYRYSIEDSVYLDPQWHGQGVGRALLVALIERCERGPWRQMIAVVADSGSAASITLHERLGFRRVGTLTAAGLKFGRWVDTELMQRPLGAGAGALPEDAS
ncbi:N-acetyltransferase family protein [Paraburkholderia sp.]|uniref:GNAT family N-acetyltransferase n=1 Tax=Paraburkholderia sp. TaxID=1926495 RepID=UPI003D6F7099